MREYEDIYVHIQETDDLSHELQPVEKMEAVEAIDRVFLKDFLKNIGEDYTLSVASDHFTFSDTGAHGGEPVPFLFYDSRNEREQDGRFTEQSGRDKQYTITAAELKAMQKQAETER